MSWKNNWNKFVRNGIVTERKKTMNERWNDFVTGQDKQNKSKQIRESWSQYLGEEEEKELIVVYFGGFKPPHRGHLAVVQDYLDMPQVKKVYILFGQKPRTNTEGDFYFHADDTEKVWNLYLEKAGIGESVDVIPVSGSPAVFAAQMAFEDQFSGMNITPGFSPKEPSYGERFTDIVNGLEKKLGEPKATLKFVPSNVNMENVSATKLRDAIADKDEEVVQNLIPDNINVEEFLSLFS